MLERHDLYQAVLGGLMGQALGDAYAMPASLRPEDTWERYGGWLTTFHPGLDDHPVHAGLPAGRITDDTEQAYALAEALIQDRGATVEGAAEAIVRWYDRIGGGDEPLRRPEQPPRL
jgi:ADP-ribosylglycohydrolase